jgi:hypothetical protein
MVADHDFAESELCDARTACRVVGFTVADDECWRASAIPYRRVLLGVIVC